GKRPRSACADRGAPRRGKAKKPARKAINTFAQSFLTLNPPLPLPPRTGPVHGVRTGQGDRAATYPAPEHNVLGEGNMYLKRNLLSAALASAIVLAATSAHAQNTQPASGESGEATNLDTVTVTGIRRGIESAISVKRDSTSIVEAISAEDIGKLPDVSIA